MELIPWSKITTVFGMPGIGGQKPTSADGAFLRRMAYAKPFKKVGSEHPHKRHIVHSFDQLRRIAAGLYRRYILHGSVSQGHPASILFRQAGITGEKVPKGSGISAGRPFLFCGIERLRKLEHSILELFQRIAQMCQHRDNPQKCQCLLILRV